MGQRIYWERVRLRERLGFEAKPADIPRRFYETPTLRGRLEPERVARMLEIYQERRAQENGRRSESKDTD
jgi:aldehyde:ferredoxin oxidoreductase